MHSSYFLRSLFGSCIKTAPSSSKSACCRALFRCCQLPLLPAEKSRPCSIVNCGFRIDEPHKKRYTIFRRCSCAARRRGVAQLVARLLWEQEAASSSLATPILQTHVDSIRVNVHFYFADKLDGENPNVCKNCAHCKAAFKKTEQPFFLFPPFCGIDKSPQVRYTE